MGDWVDGDSINKIQDLGRGTEKSQEMTDSVCTRNTEGTDRHPQEAVLADFPP